jgi:phosphoribosylglycinamide formyltransferase 1
VSWSPAPGASRCDTADALVSALTPAPFDSRRIVVLASGSGSNLQAIIDACTDGRLPADVVGIVTNRPDAYARVRAADAGIETAIVEPFADEPRSRYDGRLAAVVQSFVPDWIVLAGWMRLLTMSFLGHFPGKVLNLHPAMPGELAGTRAIERAWDEARQGRRTESGVMVHLVPDEGVDDGPLLGFRVVPIDVSGTLEAFAAAVHDTEHELLVTTLVELCSSD